MGSFFKSHSKSYSIESNRCLNSNWDSIASSFLPPNSKNNEEIFFNVFYFKLFVKFVFWQEKTHWRHWTKKFSGTCKRQRIHPDKVVALYFCGRIQCMYCNFTKCLLLLYCFLLSAAHGPQQQKLKNKKWKKLTFLNCSRPFPFIYS